MAVRHRIHCSDTERDAKWGSECMKGRCNPTWRAGHAWCWLNLRRDEERHYLKGQPSSRTGENPPYGMIGGTLETSASFEARYAPLSYPTAGCGDDPQPDLRGRLPRLFLWVPARSRPTSSAGRADTGHPTETSELGARCGHFGKHPSATTWQANSRSDIRTLDLNRSGRHFEIRR